MKLFSHALAAILGVGIGIAVSQYMNYCEHLKRDVVIVKSPTLQKLYSTLDLYYIDPVAFKSEADRFAKDLERRVIAALDKGPIDRALPEACEDIKVLDILGERASADRIAASLLGHRDDKREQSLSSELRKEVIRGFAYADIYRRNYAAEKTPPKQ